MLDILPQIVAYMFLIKLCMYNFAAFKLIKNQIKLVYKNDAIVTRGQ